MSYSLAGPGGGVSSDPLKAEETPTLPSVQYPLSLVHRRHWHTYKSVSVILVLFHDPCIGPCGTSTGSRKAVALEGVALGLKSLQVRTLGSLTATIMIASSSS